MPPPRFLTVTEHPVFGFLVSFLGLPIAATGPNFGPPFRECTEALRRLGHRRIVMIARPQRRLPCPGGDAVLDWQIPAAAQFKWDSAP